MNLTQDLQRAYAALKAGRPSDALVTVNHILRRAPKSAMVIHLKGLCQRDLGLMDEAVSSLSESVELEPDNPEFWNNYATLLRRVDRFSDAETAYRRALELKPNWAPVAMNLANLLNGLKRNKAAVDVVNAAMEVSPKHQGLLIAKGNALKSLKRYTEALEVYQTVLDQDPCNLPAVYGSASCRLELGDVESAEHSFDGLVRQAHDSSEIAFMAARSKFEAGKLDDARELFEQAHVLNPTVEAFDHLANFYWMTAEFAAFEHIVQTALEGVDENSARAIRAIDLLSQSGRSRDALEFVSRWSNRLAGSADFHVAAARSARAEGELDLAMSQSEQAVSAAPDDLSCCVERIISMLSLARSDEALRSVEQLLESNRYEQSLIAYRCDALRQRCDPDFEKLFDADRFVRAYKLVPSGVLHTETEFNAALGERLYANHFLKHHPLNQSLRNGTQTVRGLTTHPDPIIQAYIEALNEPISAYLDDIGTDPDHPHTARNTGQFRLTGAFSVRLRKGGYHVNHCHPEGWISSAYYVQVPQEVQGSSTMAGWIGFGEPPYPCVVDMPVLKWIEPKEGELVLFPSFMWHGTRPITTDTPRMTAPFDAVPG